MLAIISTHPIQYQVPIWTGLAQDGRVPFEVWYLSEFGISPSLDPQFGKVFRWDIETLSGYTYRTLKTAKGASPTDFWKCRLQERLRERILASGVKAVWIQGWQVAGYWQAVHEAVKSGVEVWLRGESNDLASVPLWKVPIKYSALRYFFSCIDRFLCIGSANRRLYRKYGVSPTKLYDAPYAVDNDRFMTQSTQLRSSRAAIRREWNISDDAFCVLFCGKFIAKKRPLDLIHAANLLRMSDRTPNIHLLFVGAGELGQDLRATCRTVFDAEKLGVAKVSEGAVPATFAGFLNQTEISKAYVAADCLVLPSDSGETWGLVVNEALASGLPCITSDQCGCAENLIGPEWSFRMGDSAGLANKIDDLSSARKRYESRAVPALSQTVEMISHLYDEMTQSALHQ